MASEPYSRMLPHFWTGETGVEIARLGCVYTQLLSAYVVANNHTHMTGVYYLPVGYIVEDLRNISYEQVTECINNLVGIKYCEYDFDNRYIWVRKMLSYQAGQSINPKNVSQIKCINKQVNIAVNKKISFMEDFLSIYMASHMIELS